MTYQKGSVIRASDINSFLTDTYLVYGVGNGDSGYGQTAISESTNHVVGQPVLASTWSNLRSMIVVCANQQGTDVSSLPPSNLFAIGQNIIAYETAAPSSQPYEVAGNITAINTNRLNASNSSMSITTGVWSITRSTKWQTITGEVSVSWSTEDNARYYFNSAGQIRMTGSHPTGTVEDARWANTLANLVGTVKFAAHATTNTGSFAGSHAIGYYELTDSYQLIYSCTQAGATSYYAAENITIYAKRLSYGGVHGGNGAGVQFQINLADTGSYYTGYNASGTSFSFDNVRATTYLTGITAPNYATVTPF